VRIEDRYDTDIDDLWSALTDPGRLASWYGQVEGDLRPGGEFRLYIESDDWDGTTLAGAVPLSTASPDDFKGAEGLVQVVAVHRRPNSL
jgi:hypothetical protein